MGHSQIGKAVAFGAIILRVRVPLPQSRSLGFSFYQIFVGFGRAHSSVGRALGF